MPTIKLFGGLRRHGRPTQQIAKGATVAALLHELCKENPPLAGAIFVNDQLAPYVRVMVDGQDIELLDGLETAVSPTAEIAVFPPIAGGD
jgi:molybdopterin synthase sulfur carrier subunit